MIRLLTFIIDPTNATDQTKASMNATPRQGTLVFKVRIPYK